MSKLSLNTFAYLDVETTGLSPWFGDRICEIAVVRCTGENVIDRFTSLLNPERPISPGAARVNGLKDSDLQNSPRFAEIAEHVTTLIQDAVVVCHNVPFDLGFLSSELGRINRHLPTVLTLDTLEIARQYFDFDSNSLQSIAHWLDIRVTGQHRALDDVFTTREVLKYFAHKLRTTEIELAIVPYYPPATSPQELNLPPVITEALQSKKRLFIRYIDRKGDVSERWVTPKQILVLNDYLYMVAHCHLRDEERNFRLDRIEQMEIELQSTKQRRKTVKLRNA
ncbi:MAG TPA: exonuclease domain-containing protein [Anaerolineales bacterium]|nr:exonuclease domain-containing protein [Anaerolineales bacterium]HLO33287.1 exonuclease domain-containing protein [Anaerolineales bacterium]